MPTESLPDDKRPLQFTLRTLLLIVSALAATLGAVRWLGAEVLPFILMAVGIWLTARTKARHLLVWLVPALWSMCVFGSWHHRGDEYGHFDVCILPCIWLALLPLKFGHLSEVYQLLIAAGALPMAAFGFLLDRLPVSRRLWGVACGWQSSSWPQLLCSPGDCCRCRHWRRPSARTVGACGFHGSRRMPSAPQI